MLLANMKKQLIKELKEMIKFGKGYLTIRDFVKDFDLSNVTISNLSETSTDFEVSIRTGHKYEYLTGFNFGW